MLNASSNENATLVQPFSICRYSSELSGQYSRAALEVLCIRLPGSLARASVTDMYSEPYYSTCSVSTGLVPGVRGIKQSNNMPLYRVPKRWFSALY